MRYPWAVPGAKVVCIKEGAWRYYMEGEVHPTNGQILTIREITDGDDGDIYFRFKEISNPPTRIYGTEAKYAARRFRPLTTHTVQSDVAIFAPLLVLTPAPNVPMLPTKELTDQ